MAGGYALDDSTYGAPDPHGPDVGGDAFKAAMQSALSPLGLSVVWVDKWAGSHTLLGGVQDAAVVARAPRAWWEELAAAP